MAVTIIQEIICHEIIYDPYHTNTINLKVTIYPLRSFGYTAESIEVNYNYYSHSLSYIMLLFTAITAIHGRSHG